MRVAIAEDDQIYRTGLVKLLELAGVEVVAAVASGAELLAQLAAGARPDAVLLDLNMAGRRDDGLQAALELRRLHPAVGILLLTGSADARIAEQLFVDGSAGKGYMLKESLTSIPELTHALDRIVRGQTYSDPLVVDELLARQRSGGARDLLTPRETSILSHLATGASNAAIAQALHTSTGAVEVAVSAIYRKLGIPDEPTYNRRVLVVLRWLRDRAGGS